MIRAFRACRSSCRATRSFSSRSSSSSISHIEEHDSVCSELVFVKLHAQSPSTRDDIRQLCSLYEGRIVDSTEDELIVELANVPSRIDAFLDVISNFEIVEMSRSGVTAIRR